MRSIAVLLIIANICLAAYSQLNELTNAPDPNLGPIKPERVKLLTPQAVAALGPSKVAQLNISCAEWGPFTEREREKVLALLKPMELGKTLSVQRAELKNVYAISLTVKPGKNAAEKIIEQLSQAGFDEAIPDAETKPNVVLGVYRNEEIGNARLKELEQKGFTATRLMAREQTAPGVLFVIREPQQSTVAALETARASAPQAALNFAACRERS
jgi:hypothetical protein